MKRYDPSAIARSAIAAAPNRPTVTIVHHQDDGRLVVFRLEPDQQVATHTSTASVFLSVVSGSGFITGAEGEENASAGEMFAFAPREPHGMRTGDHPMVVAAVITPRPGGR
jgi:quercetin dioxygenase-like cupin family protein